MSILLVIENSIRTIKRCEPKKDFDIEMNKRSLNKIKEFYKENGFENIDEL
ncbi:hypothetical protein PJV92_00775 [Aliarcobacter butzleri]|uniref:Uncharacterized protein n=2 Tax=Arcobacteraceae TaxID=2808963 RepID=A0AAP4PWR2_9BACT|nr:hypothetical protein [Aliarcobacter butzleri]MDN5053195.1 hypothetical protein [Aliarcobacter butzleri]MDN5076341.1 hypothetical protein [Aliarcobacter butzleri]MDN5117629.1 hypothetical protein [Aliarcobacter butzleri]MDN5131248.1 hypothetical protein [Aliarcobacter butzleri]